MTTKLDVKAIRARAEAATPGPWHSMHDGNQYIKTGYMPTAECVGASRIEEVPRPWNPHALLAFGLDAKGYEISRFLNADGDFIAAARTDIPALCDRVEELEAERDALLGAVRAVGVSVEPRDGGGWALNNVEREAALAQVAALRAFVARLPTEAGADAWISERGRLNEHGEAACTQLLSNTAEAADAFVARVRAAALEEVAVLFDEQPHLLEKWKDVARILRERALATPDPSSIAGAVARAPKCKTCGGSGEVPTARFNEGGRPDYEPCPDCAGRAGGGT